MRIALAALLCVVLLAGCTETNVDQQQKKKPPVLGAQLPPPQIPDPPNVDRDGFDYPRGGRVELKDQNSGGEMTQRVKAEVGVGVKGRRLEDERLVKTIVTPAIALFRTRERVVFEVQIPHAMQIYEGLNGHKPKTQDEFFKEIIEGNRIPLPELPAGERYIYDPEKGELLVERPVR